MANYKDQNICYLVTYRDQKEGQILELKVGKIHDSSLGLSFICLEDFLFENNSPLIDPEEESKRKRFENIKSLHLSIYSIISIAEVGKDTPKLAFKNDKAKLFVLQNNEPISPDTNS